MEFAIIATVALFASTLALYSGFGLGTLLMPVFAIFFPVEIAVAATAVVHGSTNILKAGLLGKFADWSIVLRFGIPAIIAAFAGAATLGYVSHFGEIASYSLGPWTAVMTPIKLLLGILIFVFALFELLPGLRDLKFDQKYLAAGGVLSGFFGGFSGHQGALRSAFLVKVGISTEAFVGTNAVIGFMVDIARITTYAAMFYTAGPFGTAEGPLVVTGILGALTGVALGRRFLHKITMKTVQTITGILLLGIALALSAGIA